MSVYLTKCLDVDSIEIEEFKNKKCLLNLAYTNKKVNEINNDYNKRLESVGVNVNGWNLWKGQRLISKKNVTVDNVRIVKNKEYFIRKIKEDVVKFDDFEIEKKDLQGIFNLCYCMTIHKSQGSTFDDEYKIYEWEKLSTSLKYVALSRGRDIEKIYIDM